MNKVLLLSLCCRNHVFASRNHVFAEPVRLILDTDLGGGGCMDVDDVGALCMAHALADNGEVELLAVVQDTSPLLLAGAISVVNHYYGRDVPIGAYKGTDLNPKAPFLPYVTDLVAHWPSPIANATQVPSSAQVYRQTLAGQPDQSVVVSAVGLLTSLAELLRSEPDEYSYLNGIELVAQKVRLLAVMGGEYPSSGGEPKGCNFCGCVFGDDPSSARAAAAAASFVFSKLPGSVQVMLVGGSVGKTVQSGGRLASCSDRGNPCRQAYVNYLANPPIGPPASTRPSWDPLTTLAAIRGPAAAGAAECTNCNGKNTVDAITGSNDWVFGPPSNQTYLVLKNAEAAGAAIDELLCQPPQRKLTPQLED